MNDLQVKFTVTLVLVAMFLAMFIPEWNKLKKMHDDTLQMYSQPYTPPAATEK